MILYRADNIDQNNNSIRCNIDCMNVYNRNKDIYDETHNKEMSLSFDRIIGHISGKNISCWISTSSDFNFVASEYAIPQAGRYNTFQYRKNIVVINSNNEINNLTLENRHDKNYTYIGKYIDLSQNKLKELVNSNIVKPLYQNEKSCRYDYIRIALNELNGKTYTNVDGFSNFATVAKEYLFYREIPKKDIVKILNPLEQDLIYIETYGKNINEVNKIVFESLEKYKNLDLKNYNFTNEEMNIINLIYNKNKFGQYLCIINLIPDFYFENSSVSELYDALKNIKRRILSKITGYKNIPLVDDEIYAVDYYNIINRILPNGKPITKLNKNDIIYQVDKDKKLIKNGYKNSFKNV